MPTSRLRRFSRFGCGLSRLKIVEIKRRMAERARLDGTLCESKPGKVRNFVGITGKATKVVLVGNYRMNFKTILNNQKTKLFHFLLFISKQKKSYQNLSVIDFAMLRK